MLKVAQAVIFISGDDDDNRLTILGDGLRISSRGLYKITEAIFGVPNGPYVTNHALRLSSSIFIA